MKKLELLAPAGNLSILKSVITAGADAVYVGGDLFGARAYAKNFTEVELLEALDYAHLRGKKIYLTINTLLKNKEIEDQLFSYVLPFYMHGLDGVIVQDFGVISFLRRNFPDLPLHASTQMAICNASGATFLKKFGITRVVAARELSLAELKHIYDETGLEMESFVHGALCYSFSGQCLMSSMIGGRSGNRGRCAGTCRLPMAVSGQKMCYPLSLKDLCTIEFLPQIIESGVCSFKIEGRMKSLAYAAGVTEIYRKYLDQYLQNGTETYHVSKKDTTRLLNLGNRSGFTDGYYRRHNGKDMLSLEKPSHTHGEEAFLLDVEKRYSETSNPVFITGTAEFKTGKPMSLTIDDVCVTGPVCEEASNAPADADNLRQKLYKTKASDFMFQNLEIEIEDAPFVPVKSVNELRRDALSLLKEKRLKPFMRPEVEKKESEKIEIESFTVAPLLSILISTEEQLEVVKDLQGVERIYIESDLILKKNNNDLCDEIKRWHKKGLSVWIALPFVFRMDTEKIISSQVALLEKNGIDGYLIRNFDSLAFMEKNGISREKILLDERMYVFSDEAIKAFEHLGYHRFTAPLELNEKELCHRLHQTEELILYGRIPLMITANCIHKNFYGCDQKETTEKLTDRYDKTFPVQNKCEYCYNLILNADCLNLIPKKDMLEADGYHSFRLQFTTESASEMKKVIGAYKTGEKLTGTFTNGHFKRGVE